MLYMVVGACLYFLHMEGEGRSMENKDMYVVPAT